MKLHDPLSIGLDGLLMLVKYVTGFWKTYYLHTSEIIRIFDFEPLWFYVTEHLNVFLQVF